MVSQAAQNQMNAVAAITDFMGCLLRALAAETQSPIRSLLFRRAYELAGTHKQYVTLYTAMCRVYGQLRPVCDQRTMYFCAKSAAEKAVTEEEKQWSERHCDHEIDPVQASKNGSDWDFRNMTPDEVDLWWMGLGELK